VVQDHVSARAIPARAAVRLMSRSPVDDLEKFRKGWARASAPEHSFAVNLEHSVFGRLRNDLRFPSRGLAMAYAASLRQRYGHEEVPVTTHIVGTADSANVTYAAGGGLVLLPREGQGG
jgi:hypothetical protein